MPLAIFNAGCMLDAERTTLDRAVRISAVAYVPATGNPKTILEELDILSS